MGVNASAATSKHSPAETETSKRLRVLWPGHCVVKQGSCYVVLARGTCTARSNGFLGLRKQRKRRRHMPSQRKQLGECERDHTAQR